MNQKGKLRAFVIGTMLVVIAFGESKAQGKGWAPPQRIINNLDTGVFFTRESEGILIEKALDRVILERMVIDYRHQIEALTNKCESFESALKLRDRQISGMERDISRCVSQRDYFYNQANDELIARQKAIRRQKTIRYVSIGLALIGGYAANDYLSR